MIIDHVGAVVDVASIRSHNKGFMRWLVKQPLLAFFVVWSGLQSGAKIEFEHGLSLSRKDQKPNQLLAIEDICGSTHLEFCGAVSDVLALGENLPIATINP
jgi:hypothetical protein